MYHAPASARLLVWSAPQPTAARVGERFRRAPRPVLARRLPSREPRGRATGAARARQIPDPRAAPPRARDAERRARQPRRRGGVRACSRRARTAPTSCAPRSPSRRPTTTSTRSPSSPARTPSPTAASCTSRCSPRSTRTVAHVATTTSTACTRATAATSGNWSTHAAPRWRRCPSYAVVATPALRAARRMVAYQASTTAPRARPQDALRRLGRRADAAGKRPALVGDRRRRRLLAGRLRADRAPPGRPLIGAARGARARARLLPLDRRAARAARQPGRPRRRRRCRSSQPRRPLRLDRGGSRAPGRDRRARPTATETAARRPSARDDPRGHDQLLPVLAACHRAGGGARPQGVLEAMGPLATPTMLVLRARRTAGRLLGASAAIHPSSVLPAQTFNWKLKYWTFHLLEVCWHDMI